MSHTAIVPDILSLLNSTMRMVRRIRAPKHAVPTRSSEDDHAPEDSPQAPNLLNEIQRQDRRHVTIHGLVLMQRGTWTSKGIPVTISYQLRQTSGTIDEWLKASHTNVMPIYGTWVEPPTLSFVCPFVPEGSLIQYCETREIDPATRRHLILEVAIGLAYLHSNDIVHGDLRGENVLVTHVLDHHLRLHPRAILANFGAAKLISKGITDVTTLDGERWTAWELHDATLHPEKYTQADLQTVLTCSDVWSWGMTVLETFTEMPPYASVLWDVQKVILANKHPRFNRRECKARGLNSVLRSLMKACWKRRPADRPSASRIVQTLKGRIVRPSIDADYDLQPGPDVIANPSRQLTRVGRKPVLFYARTARRSHASSDIPSSSWVNPTGKGWLVAVTKLDNVTGWWEGRSVAPLGNLDPWIPTSIVDDLSPLSTNALISGTFPYITRATQTYKSATWLRSVDLDTLLYITKSPDPTEQGANRYTGFSLKDLGEISHCTFPCNHIRILPHGRLKQDGVICWGLFIESFGISIKTPRAGVDDLVFDADEVVAVTHAPMYGYWEGELVDPGLRKAWGRFPRDTLKPF